MLKITLLLCITFGVLFSMLYAFIQYENKKDGGKDSKSILLITAAIFSAVLTAVIAFLLFVLLGSTTLLDSVFSLQMGNHLLLQIGIPYFIYWIVVEPFVKKGGQQFIRNTVLTLLFIALMKVWRNGIGASEDLEYVDLGMICVKALFVAVADSAGRASPV